MSKIKEFLMQIPYLCGSENAERWSRIIELQYDDELSNKNSVFKRNSIDFFNPANRLETAFGFDGDKNKIEYCKKLVELIILNHYVKEHDEIKWLDRIDELEIEITPLENEYTEISDAMSIEKIRTLEGWNV